MEESIYSRDLRYLIGLRERPKAAREEVVFRAVSVGKWKAKPKECHENVAYWVKRNPQHQHVRGWLVCNEDFLIAHAVVRDPTCAKLVDITPLDHDGPFHGMRFIRHLGSDEEFCEIRKRHSALNWGEFCAA
jgi:hypothetical protein